MSKLSPAQRDAKKTAKWFLRAQDTSSAPTLQQSAVQTQNQAAQVGDQSNPRAQIPMQT